jgi:hypothetical protein
MAALQINRIAPGMQQGRRFLASVSLAYLPENSVSAALDPASAQED